MADIISIPQKANECPEDKYLNRHVVNEVAAACAYHTDIWRDLGIELLGQDGRTGLDVIKANHSDDVTKCCSAMLTLWRQRQTNASWRQLIEALKQLNLNRVATEIEKLLKSSTEQEYEIAGAMQDLNITPAQQQDLQTTNRASLQKESSIASLSPVHTTNTVQQSKALVKFSENWDIEAAYNNMTSAVETVLTAGHNFPQLRRACIHKIKSLKSNLPHKLIPQILQTSSMNELLDMLAQSEYWNWFDTRLLEALTYASGSPEAIELLEHFKKTFYPRKINEFIPYEFVKPFKEFTSLNDKFDKDPSEVTVYELLEHKYKIEYEVLDIDEGELVLSCIKTGCVELTWQIPRELVYRAYTSMKRKHDELSSLAVKSLVCKAADELAGLPILWRGQEVGEVGSIEPLPEHVRQEPYSLPQGFHWVTLSSSDVEEVLKFSQKYIKDVTIDLSSFNYIMSYPNTKDEWQFGIRTANGKLVAVVLAFPACISIGGVSLTCVQPCIAYHSKYHGKRIWYMLNKELMRKLNLCNINHLFTSSQNPSILKPISIMRVWNYIFDYPTNTQLSSSPRTPGWRRMTSEDVPSALALINKWSSQFEIRQVFNSEEEFAHEFLCPVAPNYVFTYVVENEANNNITDLVSFSYVTSNEAVITTVASTQTPVKQLIIDALVCVKESGSKVVAISQRDIKSDVLLSLSFQRITNDTLFIIYNYKYQEVSDNKLWCAAF